jgi:hypothetical protein
MGEDQQISWLERTVSSAMRGAFQGFRFGPGVLATIVPVILVGLPVLGAVVWSLRGEPYLATAALAFGLIFLAYVIERSFRYAEKNPIPALLGGGELFQLLRDQTAAKDGSIINDSPPIPGAGSVLIEGRGERHE